MAGELHRYHDYAQADPPHQPLFLALVLRYLATAGPGATVLDAGCGDGNFTASVAEAGYRCHGVDLSEGGIARARERHPDIAFAVASLNDDLRTVFPGVAEFDAVISIEVIEHLYSPVTFARRIKESLKPGGIAIITTPYWGYLKNVLLALTNRMDRSLTALWEGGHIKHWSCKTMRQLFGQAGFEFVAFHGCGRRIPYVWRNMLMVVRKPES